MLEQLPKVVMLSIMFGAAYKISELGKFKLNVQTIIIPTAYRTQLVVARKYHSHWVLSLTKYRSMLAQFNSSSNSEFRMNGGCIDINA